MDEDEFYDQYGDDDFDEFDECDDISPHYDCPWCGTEYPRDEES